MRWADELKERAGLMQRMLKTIGAMDRIPAGMCVGQDIRLAVAQCEHCGQSVSCQKWLDDNADQDVFRAPDLCPNASLFNSWLDAKSQSNTAD